MAEQQNIEFIRSMYDAFGRGDIRTIIEHITEDVEWIAEGPSSVAYFGTMKGPAEVQSKFFGGIAETQEDMKLAVENFVGQGDRVATFGRYSGKVRATGKRFDVALAHLFLIRDGKVSKFVNVTDTAAVAEAYSGAAAAGR
jgi:ketosteroid isomerase-like protein